MTYDEAEAKMRDAGAEHGRSAASWYFDGNTPLETYRTVHNGIRDGDPAVLDTLPSSPLSGEWADAPTPASVVRDVLDLEPDDYPTNPASFAPEVLAELLDAYEAAFYQASHDAIDRAAQSALTPSFDLDLDLGY